MKREVKNHGKSIRMKLVNIKNKTSHDYMYLLARYFNERLLYRIAKSQYSENFLLKGGSLLYAIDGLDARPTVDIDFLAKKISRDRGHLETVFKEILSIPCEEDGVTFDVDLMRSEPITVEKEYPGTRFYISAHLDTIVHNMTMDIGFGDIVTSGPAIIDYPLLLPDIPGMSIQAYSIETVIAEKFHTMIDRDELNSRMKDFFDCYQIFATKEVDNDTLRDAIFATFKNRGLVFNPNLKLFTETFYTDEPRLKRWKSFLRKINWEEIPFDKVMAIIKYRLEPILIEFWRS